MTLIAEPTHRARREYMDLVVDYLDLEVGIGTSFAPRDVVDGMRMECGDAAKITSTLKYLETAWLAVTHLEFGMWRYEGREVYDSKEPGSWERRLAARSFTKPIKPKQAVCQTCFIAIPRALTECETCA